MKVLDSIDLIDEKRWQTLLEGSKYGNFFQTRACYDLYAANESFMKPFCFAVEDNNALKGVMVGYIQSDGGKLKRYFSRRAIINAGPLLAEDISTDALSLLLQTCKARLKKKAIYIESRNFEDYSPYKDVFEHCGFEYHQHLNFHVCTTTEEVVQENLGKSRKRDVKASLKEGAEIIENPTLEEVRSFYGVLNDLYEKKIKTPLFPLSFFEYLYRQDYSKFLLIRYNADVIGGTVCVCLPNQTVYEWFACGQDGVYKNIHPSTLATYAGIVYAAQHGYKRFDMMGAGKPDQDYGVREFKAKFGGELVQHGRFVSITHPLLYQIGKFGVKIMKSQKSK